MFNELYVIDFDQLDFSKLSTQTICIDLYFQLPYRTCARPAPPPPCSTRVVHRRPMRRQLQYPSGIRYPCPLPYPWWCPVGAGSGQDAGPSGACGPATKNVGYGISLRDSLGKCSSFFKVSSNGSRGHSLVQCCSIPLAQPCARAVPHREWFPLLTTMTRSTLHGLSGRIIENCRSQANPDFDCTDNSSGLPQQHSIRSRSLSLLRKTQLQLSSHSPKLRRRSRNRAADGRGPSGSGEVKDQRSDRRKSGCWTATQYSEENNNPGMFHPVFKL